MKHYTKTLKKQINGFYVITPSNAHGEYVANSKVNYSSQNNDPLFFEDKESYLAKLDELNIEYDND